MNTSAYRNELEAAHAEIERLRAELNTSAKNVQQEEYKRTIRKHLKEKRNILQAIFISSQYCGVWPDTIHCARIRVALVSCSRLPIEIRRFMESKSLFHGSCVDRSTCWQECEFSRNELFDMISALKTNLTEDEMLTEIKAIDSELERIKTENTAAKSDT